MQHFMTWQFVAAWNFLWEISNGLERSMVSAGGAVRDARLPYEFAQNAIPKVTYCRGQFSCIGLTDAVERIDAKLIRLGWKRRLTYDEFHTQILELRDDVERQLKYRRFVFIPEEKIKALDRVAKFRDQLGGAFQKAKTEAEDAIDCYAIGKGTACVFHAMRVAEHGLRILAKRLHVKLAHKRRKSAH